MLINQITSYNYSDYNNHNTFKPISFNAVPLARYGVFADCKKDVFVYRLEKKDVSYLNHLLENLNTFFSKYGIIDKPTQVIFKHALEAGITILEDKQNIEERAKILLAVAGNDPSAILVGNALKTDKNRNYHYSSRKNQATKETELDALTTWNDKIPNKGKAILCEYFYTLLADGFKNIYVRSEIPQNSYAVEFYKKMGFETLSKKARPIQRKNDYGYVSDIFDYNNDLIIPMKATSLDMQKIVTSRSKELKRRKIKSPKSINLPKIEL